MKRIVLLIICFIFSFNISLAQDDEINNFVSNPEEFDLKGRIEYDENGSIILDSEDKNEIKLSLPKSVKAQSSEDIKDVDYRTIEKYKQISQMNSSIWSDVANSAKTINKKGSYSYGVFYTNGIDNGQMEYRTKFYTRYDAKRFAINASYGQDQYTTSGNQLNYFYLTPEWKLGKGFVLKDDFRTANTGRRKNEIILQYNPKTKKLDNNLNFEMGFGQTIYENSESYYQFKFATSFKL